VLGMACIQIRTAAWRLKSQEVKKGPLKKVFGFLHWNVLVDRLNYYSIHKLAHLKRRLEAFCLFNRKMGVVGFLC